MSRVEPTLKYDVNRCGDVDELLCVNLLQRCLEGGFGGHLLQCWLWSALGQVRSNFTDSRVDFFQPVTVSFIELDSPPSLFELKSNLNQFRQLLIVVFGGVF